MATKKTSVGKTTARIKRKSAGRTTRKWSARVTRNSDALDLESGVFTKSSPRRIAESLKRSAVSSKRRKATPFQSAMSMLNFQINRAGAGLTPARRRVLNKAKTELRKLFHREPT